MRVQKMLTRIIFVAFAILYSVGSANAEYREVTVKEGGTITGKVTFHGKLPENAVERYPVSGKWPGCGTGFRDVVRVDVKDGMLRGAFVMIEEITEGKKWPEYDSDPMVDQKNCVFLPLQQIVKRGESVIIRNSDPDVLHNINVREEVETSSGRSLQRMIFNIAQPLPGDIKKKINPKDSSFLTVGCDIHNWMVAYILATEHPYAAIVKEDGTFVIEDIPAGKYSVVVWHPTLGKKKISVKVSAKTVSEANFEFGK